MKCCSRNTLICLGVMALFTVILAPVQGQDVPASEPQSQSPQKQPPDNQDQQNQSAQPKSEPGQNSPDGAKPKEEGSMNPAQAVADKTKEVTTQAAEATKQMAQDTLVKVRDWETQWVAGAYVSRNHKLVPLTEQGRKDLYLHETLVTPGAYLKRMFDAAIDQARGSPAQWDGGWKGYGERFASREGQFISSNTLAWLGNAKLGYEPRYDQCRCQGFWPRTRHAIVRNFMTYDRTEQSMRPQLALYGGAFGGGLISTAWKPKPRNAFAEGGRAMLSQAAFGTLLNFFTEFAVDINRKLGAKP